MSLYNYMLGVGHDLPLGSLTNIEDIQPTGDRKFYPPQSFGNHDPGVYKMRGDGMVYLAGEESTKLKWRFMTRKQYKYLRTTYCNGGYSGPVTANIPIDTDGTYSRANAVMVLPKLPESGTNFTALTDVTVELIKLELL